MERDRRASRAYGHLLADQRLGRLPREPGVRPKGAAQFNAPEPFIAALADAPVTWSASLGLGSDLRVDAAGVSACALACEGLVHVTAFPAEGVA